MAKELLKEAIADAKAVREVAMQNAKLALEEAFNSKIQSMIAAKLNEELDEEELEEVYNEDEDNMEEGSYMEDEEEMEEGMEYEEDDSMEEEINLEEILNSLEEEMNSNKDKDDKMEENLDEEIDLTLEEDEDEELEEEINLDALMEELMEEESIEENIDPIIKAAEMLNTSPEVINTLGGILAGLGIVGIAGGKDLAKAMVDKGKEGAKAAFSKLKSIAGKEATNKVSEESLNEAYLTIETLRTQLAEVNLLNAKLLYVNKLFKANNLTEAQKLKVVETLDEATNVKEAKLVFNTLKESFTSTGLKKNITEGLKGFASKATGTPTKKEVLNEQVDETVARFQKLANIKF
jgi:hypothetical protein